MKQDIHWLLNRLIAYIYTAADYGWPSVSLTYKMIQGTASSSGRAGHKILAPDMPTDLRRAQVALNGLTKREQQIVTARYMPYEIDGKGALEKDRARYIGMSPWEFSRTYHKAARKMKKALKGG